MSTTVNTQPSAEQQFAELQPLAQSPQWLAAQRQQALEHFNNVGLPKVRDEQWRYTNLRALKNQTFSVGARQEEHAISLPTSAHLRMVFVDGDYRADLSSTFELGNGARLTTLAQLLASKESGQDSLISSYFGRALPAFQHGFTALNTAHCRDGFVLILDDNTVLEEALEICFVSTQQSAAQSSISHSRNLIIAGANSQCTLIERHFGNDGGVYLNNTVSEIYAGDNAHVDHYKLHQESNDAFHIGGVFIHQGKSSQVKTHNIALGGLVVRNDVRCDLNGQGAHIEMNGLVLGKLRQHIDNHTEVNHAVPNCTSDEYYRSVLDDQARSVFRGRIVVAQDAQQTSAEQQNNNLLLSALAEADTLPQLEIYADDVQCSHGATVGQLDPKSMFYLQSRGIDKDSAKALLTFAFANEVIERINVKALRQEIKDTFSEQGLDNWEDAL